MTKGAVVNSWECPDDRLPPLQHTFPMVQKNHQVSQWDTRGSQGIPASRARRPKKPVEWAFPAHFCQNHALPGPIGCPIRLPAYATDTNRA
jgi:hypothetical protein